MRKLLIACAILITCVSHAQEVDNICILDKETITSQYEEPGTVRLDFDKGQLAFEGIAGP